MQRKQIPAYFVSKETHLGTLTYPEETSEVTPIPSSGVEHVGNQDSVDDADNVAELVSIT